MFSHIGHLLTRSVTQCHMLVVISVTQLETRCSAHESCSSYWKLVVLLTSQVVHAGIRIEMNLVLDDSRTCSDESIEVNPVLNNSQITSRSLVRVLKRQ